MTRTTSWKIFWTVYKLQESLPNIADSHFLSIDHHSQDKKHYSDRRDPQYKQQNTIFTNAHQSPYLLHIVRPGSCRSDGTAHSPPLQTWMSTQGLTWRRKAGGPWWTLSSLRSGRCSAQPATSSCGRHTPATAFWPAISRRRLSQIWQCELKTPHLDHIQGIRADPVGETRRGPRKQALTELQLVLVHPVALSQIALDQFVNWICKWSEWEATSSGHHILTWEEDRIGRHVAHSRARQALIQTFITSGRHSVLKTPYHCREMRHKFGI